MVNKLLELFSGTKSVSKVAQQIGYEVVSLDLKDADINTDILNWDYTIYPVGYFNFIWASPPCTEYSKAKTTAVRKIDEANQIVLKTLEIIDYFKPTYYILENPQTGLLKNQSFMDGIPFTDIDYCKYGMLYRKRTRLWNNINLWNPRPLCNKDCGNIRDNKHIATAQRMPQGRKDSWGDKPLFKQQELYIIPEELIQEIFQSII